jgi:hypothetical protein
MYGSGRHPITKMHKEDQRMTARIILTLAAWLALTACNPITAPQEAPMTTNQAAKPPAYVTALQAAYGAPNQAAFGSAVFYEPKAGGTDLAALGLTKYRYFVGDLWERYGEDAWMGPWRQVYARPAAAAVDIVAELRAIADPDAARSIPMILDNINGAEQARASLAAAFDDPAMSEVGVFNLGDSGAMSGILVAGRRAATGEAIFLVFLLD